VVTQNANWNFQKTIPKNKQVTSYTNKRTIDSHKTNTY